MVFVCMRRLIHDIQKTDMEKTTDDLENLRKDEETRARSLKKARNEIERLEEEIANPRAAEDEESIQKDEVSSLRPVITSMTLNCALKDELRPLLQDVTRALDEHRYEIRQMESNTRASED